MSAISLLRARGLYQALPRPLLRLASLMSPKCQIVVRLSGWPFMNQCLGPVRLWRAPLAAAGSWNRLRASQACMRMHKHEIPKGGVSGPRG